MGREFQLLKLFLCSQDFSRSWCANNGVREKRQQHIGRPEPGEGIPVRCSPSREGICSGKIIGWRYVQLKIAICNEIATENKYCILFIVTRNFVNYKTLLSHDITLYFNNFSVKRLQGCKVLSCSMYLFLLRSFGSNKRANFNSKTWRSWFQNQLRAAVQWSGIRGITLQQWNTRGSPGHGAGKRGRGFAKDFLQQKWSWRCNETRRHKYSIPTTNSCSRNCLPQGIVFLQLQHIKIDLSCFNLAVVEN